VEEEKYYFKIKSYIE